MMEMSELTSDGDGWVDQWWMGELTSDGDGWVDQWWRWVSWPMMEMGELTSDGDGWVDQWWRWVSWPTIEVGELTNGGGGGVDQWWRWVSWLNKLSLLCTMHVHQHAQLQCSLWLTVHGDLLLKCRQWSQFVLLLPEIRNYPLLQQLQPSNRHLHSSFWWERDLLPEHLLDDAKSGNGRILDGINQEWCDL